MTSGRNAPERRVAPKSSKASRQALLLDWLLRAEFVAKLDLLDPDPTWESWKWKPPICPMAKNSKDLSQRRLFSSALRAVVRLQASVRKVPAIISAKSVSVWRHTSIGAPGCPTMAAMAAISPLCANSSSGTVAEWQKRRSEEARCHWTRLAQAVTALLLQQTDLCHVRSWHRMCCKTRSCSTAVNQPAIFSVTSVFHWKGEKNSRQPADEQRKCSQTQHCPTFLLHNDHNLSHFVVVFTVITCYYMLSHYHYDRIYYQ